MSSSLQIPEADITAAWAYADSSPVGYLYALHFTGPDGDVVKVGRTIDIETRFKNHNKQAAAMRLELVEQWVSEPHINIITTETAFIRFCKERWSIATGMEWFRDANYGEVVEFGTQIPKIALQERHRKARAAKFLDERNLGYSAEAITEAVGWTEDDER